jgi:uncharacterized phage protein gp47/JayE
MPFDRPSLDTLRERIWQDLTNKLPGARTSLRVSNLRVFGEVEAGSAHLLYGRLYWNFLQLFPDTAELEYLEQWASIWGVRRTAATRAFGPMIASAQAGSEVRRGDILQLEGGKLLYRVRGTSLEFGGEVRFQVEAVDYGIAPNQVAGTVLRFQNTRVGVAPIASVLPPGIIGGAEQDTDEELLQALLNRIQQPPHGGNKNDYEQWMYQIAGVTRAWCYPLERGLGTVVLRFMMDDVRAGAPQAPDDRQGNSGIPTNGDTENMWRHIDRLRPVTADLGPDASLELQPPFTPPDPQPPLVDWGWGYIFPPWPKAQRVEIQGLMPDSLDIRAAIAAELQDMIRHESAPGKTLLLSSFYLAIGTAPGVRNYRLLIPPDDVPTAPGEIITLGSITFVP